MDIYSTSDLQSLICKLQGVAAKWKRIGLHLGLTSGKLDVIRVDYHSCEDRLLKVIQTWLASGRETTSEQISSALLLVGERKVAEDINPTGFCGVSGNRDSYFCSALGYLKILMQIIFMVVVTVVCLSEFNANWNTGVLTGLLYKYGALTRQKHFSSIPPISKELFFGREKDTKAIMELVNNPNITVVNVYAARGSGKYITAKHVGHAMRKQGFDVRFMSLENIDIPMFENKVSLITDGKTVSQWAINVNETNIKTLIVLVKTGNYWYEHIYELKKNFINPITAHSDCIKILIMSTNRLYGIDRSVPYLLPKLDWSKCVFLIRALVNNISVEDSEKICIMGDGNPQVIKIVASVLKPPSVYTVDYVTNSLRTNSINFIKRHSGMVDKDNELLNAIEHGVSSLTEECYLSSLLLVRTGEYFDLGHMNIVISKEIRKYMTGSVFLVEHCLHQLIHAQLVETLEIEDYSMGQVFIRHHFRRLAHNFLKNKKVSDVTLLEKFWRNYYDHHPKGMQIRSDFLTCEDIEMFNETFHSIDDYAMLSFIINNKTIGCDGCLYIELTSRVIIEKFNCSIPSHSFGHIMLRVWFVGKHRSQITCSVQVDNNYTEPEVAEVEGRFFERCDYQCAIVDSNQFSCQRIGCGYPHYFPLSPFQLLHTSNNLSG